MALLLVGEGIEKKPYKADALGCAAPLLAVLCMANSSCGESLMAPGGGADVGVLEAITLLVLGGLANCCC